METATGTLMFGIFAVASLPMIIGLLVWGLSAETSTGGIRLADQGRRTDLRRAA